MQSGENGHSQVTLDIIRETGNKANWLNRFVRDAETNVAHLLQSALNFKEINYYCEVTPDSKLVIHGGDKTAPIIASANACLVTPGVTDIHLTDPLYTIELEHIVHEDSSKTRFTPNSVTYYYWKGHVDLVREHPEAEIATFYPSWLVDDFNHHKIGKLVVHSSDKDVIDLAVITSLVVQERSDEARQAVTPDR